MAKIAHQIYLLRHGEVAAPSALYGKTDVPLSPRGWQNMEAQCARLSQLTQVVSSPLQRCQHFARQLSEQRNLTLQVLDEMQECDFGKWDGVAFDDIPQSAWAELHAFWQAPASNPLTDAEPLTVMYQRVSTGWQKLAKQLASTQTPQTLLLICHGGVIRLLLAHLLNLDWRNPALYSQWQIGYASLSKFTLPATNHAQAIIHYVGMPAEHEI
ncbi:histidine phosphatase family protein [Planctobacterium marinum]|uniref:histidine phosphatase family protein n=1 Tax=Planctobacterium marinum TaxID=1631968 RepID=UPI001E28FD39|nr:histidine phosphatase family protein [Planctobacterium marinum]MCC2606755.1 histidine phosphatase family protein [Planctobacterium marinum]